jgi:hypothetical protein
MRFGQRKSAAEEQPPTSQETGTNPLSTGLLHAGVTEKIASCKSDLGTTLYSDILKRVAQVRNPREIANPKLQQVVLRLMEVCLRGTGVACSPNDREDPRIPVGTR